MADAWQMSAEDAEEYTRALGQIMSGGWRQIALAQRLGVPEAIGMTTEAWVRERIGGYVRLGLDERREAVKELTDPDGEFHLSQRQAAEVLGIGQASVHRALRDDPNESLDDLFQPGDDAAADSDESLDEWTAPEAEAPRLASPVVGDVGDDIREQFDEEGLAAERALARHIDTMAGVRATWLRFVSEHPPGVFARGLDRNGLSTLLRDLDRFISWLDQARDGARAARRPQRVV
jgi:transcriptional regulator with XRE-family HTH domain